MQAEVFTLSEVVEMLGLTRQTICKMAKRGTLRPAFYINNRPRYLLDDIKKAVTLTPQKIKSNG